MIKPGEVVMKVLLRQLTVLAKLKVEKAMEECHETNLAKVMKLNDDFAFEQLLNAFNVVAEFALPSILSTLIQWYLSQHSSGAQHDLHKRQYFDSCKDSNENNASVYNPMNFLNNEAQSNANVHVNKCEKNVKLVSESLVVSNSLSISVENRYLFERRDVSSN